ncbi:MAG: hypothetical protein AB7E95_03435 [Kiritimatiellales bacterium]
MICLPVLGLEKGASRNEVIAELGKPRGTMQYEDKEVLLFASGTVTLRGDTVISMDLSEQYVKEAAERAQEAKRIRAEKQAELEQQKIRYPADHVVQIPCSYTKTERWDYLPKSIRPAAGSYRYDVYIPKGYHESARHVYSCLLLESPALWDSVKERMRNEKLLVVIIPDAESDHAGRDMNSNFLAAYDDATERFRISRNAFFIAGRVPAAIFASMRRVSGVILHEPDFSGIQNAGTGIDLLRKNNTLRTYILLGNRDRNNVIRQGQFATELFNKELLQIYIYQGYTAVLPKQLADHALDWIEQ